MDLEWSVDNGGTWSDDSTDDTVSDDSSSDDAVGEATNEADTATDEAVSPCTVATISTESDDSSLNWNWLDTSVDWDWLWD
jgi:hypothetical protein